MLLNSPNRQGTASRYHGKDISISPFVYKIDNGWEARSHPVWPLALFLRAWSGQGSMLCRVASVQSMNVLQKLDANVDKARAPHPTPPPRPLTRIGIPQEKLVRDMA